MGTVYLAEHVLIERRAAIKVLHPELSQDPEIVRRFLNEAKATTAVGVPGIVQIFDFGTHDDGTAFIVMELLEGESLAARLRKGLLPLDKALGLLRQICGSLAAAHACGIIHRDLKPENIYLVADRELPDGERTKLLDFGIAKVQRAPLSGKTTAVGVIMGSPTYMSPEQCRGDSTNLDRRSDIYSLGCIFFEVLTGQPPFKGPSPGELIAAHLYEPAVAPSSLAPWVSEELDEIVLCCLAKRAEERFASCELLIAALDDAALSGGDAPAGGASRGSLPLLLRNPLGALIGPPEPRFRDAPGAAPGAAIIAPSASPTMMVEARGNEGKRSSERMRIAQAEADTLFETLEAVLPRGLQDANRLLYAFFSELFASAEQVREGLLRLHAGAAIRDLAQRQHFAIFVDEVERVRDEALGQLGTMVFESRVNPLAAAIEQARAPSGSVLIVVTAASQLGKGVREIIFNLRRDKGLFVVPFALPEIQRVAGRKEARLLLLNRVADLHSVSDPFSILEQSTDPTRCVGFAREVQAIVEHISDGGQVVNIIGPPGSGKSTVVAMAQYGCDEARVSREYIHVDCTELPREPQEAARELRARVQQARLPIRQHFERTLIANAQPPVRSAVTPQPMAAVTATPPALGAASPAGVRQTMLDILKPVIEEAGAQPPVKRPRPGTSPQEPQLVLVLEDADWLVRMAAASNPDAEQRARAIELWRALAELCSSGGHTALVTCVRDLSDHDQVAGEKPLAFHRVALRAISLPEATRMVEPLGQLVGLTFPQKVIDHLYEECGGNVFALRLLCRAIARLTFEERNTSPLAKVTISRRHVAEAAQRVVAARTSFSGHIETWLDATERFMLQHVARERPRDVARACTNLAGLAPAQELRLAHANLQRMGFIEAQGQRVQIRLFERWIRVHMDAPPTRKVEIERRRLGRIAFGFATSALVFGFYWTWLRNTRSRTPAMAIGECNYKLDYPDRVGEGEIIAVAAYRDCATVPAVPPLLELSAVESTIHAVDTVSSCTISSPSCFTTFRLKAASQSERTYVVQLGVAGQRGPRVEMRRDSFAMIRRLGEESLQLASFLPLLLSLFIVYYRDVKQKLLSLLGRGEPAQASPPSTPSS